METKRTYIKTDKNGTEYYEVVGKCSRCGGHGTFFVGVHNGYPVPAQPDNGVCYRCGGSGVETYIEKVYTPEYRAKLDRQNQARREAEQQRRIEGENSIFFEKNGFDENGNTWVVLGNTYAIKEEIKKLGGRFNYELGWHFNYDCKDFECANFSFDDLLEINDYGLICYKSNVKEIVDNVKNEYSVQKNRESSTSEYVGNVGDKINVELTLTNYYTMDNPYSYYGTISIYTFKDNEGNVYVWKTNNGLYDYDIGDTLNIRGSIKDHKEYKGIKQTILTRCKVIN